MIAQACGRDDAFQNLSLVAAVPEIRLEVADEDVSVLDGYCRATGAARTDVLRRLLRDWSESKLHEAILICRVAGRNPSDPEPARAPAGSRPDK